LIIDLGLVAAAIGILLFTQGNSATAGAGALGVLGLLTIATSSK
jgi:hypothetical protein